MPPRARRPQGLPTRGKTAPGRLRRLDAFLCAYDPGLLRRAAGIVLDLGFGRVPITTEEMAERFWALNPRLEVVGVEIDPERVAAAAERARPGLSFRRGGFNLPLEPGEGARLVRAMNVLRQYPEPAALDAHRQLAAQLLPGGLLLEGTSDPLGQLMAVNLIRRGPAGEPRLEGLFLGTNFAQGGDPALFPPILPKNLIHRHVPGEPIHAFLSAWQAAWERAAPYGAFGVRQRFVAAAEALAARYPGVCTRRSWLRRGWVLWRWPSP